MTNQFSSFTGNPKSLSPLALAFVGDGVYELLARGHLMEAETIPIKKLHRMSVAWVNAQAQARAYNYIIATLDEAEGDILRRGRNAATPRVPKNSSVEEYHKATAVEALFGYLYLGGEMDRIISLFKLIMSCEIEASNKTENP